jgi:hypothetical protein
LELGIAVPIEKAAPFIGFQNPRHHCGNNPSELNSKVGT